MVEWVLLYFRWPPSEINAIPLEDLERYYELARLGMKSWQTR